jgi:hypothetical protein
MSPHDDAGVVGRALLGGSMSNVQVSVTLEASEVIAASVPALDQELQELWLALSAEPWRLLVLVPADAASSAAGLARSLAAAGKELGEASVTAIGDGALDRGSAVALLEGGAASSRVIVAIPPVLVEPRGVVLTRRADAVVVCIERGRTRLADVRRTVELIGGKRFLGCVLVR